MIFNFYDTFNILSKLNFRKVKNAVLLLAGYYFSRISKKEFQWGNPISISVEPTTSCNLRCPECPSGLRSFSRKTGMLEPALFQKIIDENYRDLLYLILYFQGEPYLNKHFLELVTYASKKNIYTATSTNAHYLDSETAKKTVESGLDRLIISIDGTTQETYEQYRIGGQLGKVLAGTKEVVNWKKKLKSKTPQILFQFLVVKPNEHQVNEIKQIAREIGVEKVMFKTAQIYDYENGSTLLPSIDKYSRYKKNGSGKFEIKNKLLNQCWKMWHSCVITWDGKVVPCCFDKDATHQLGDVNEISLQKIWHGKKYQSFRNSILKSRKEIDICKNCTEGTKVWTD